MARPGDGAMDGAHGDAMQGETLATASVRRAAIVNLGCKVNQSEMEAAARLLREAGIPLVAPASPADLVLVNTCTVTSTADEKSRAAVRRARRANPDAAVVVTGCSVQVGPGAFAAIDPAARLVGNDGKAALLREIEALVRLAGPAGASPADASPTGASWADAAPAEPLAPLVAALPTLAGVEPADPIDGIVDGRASVERTRAFVKVQDGCSFYCTYCIIPRARGPERSLAPETVLAGVRRALDAGHREIVLTGINIGTYDGGWSERGRRGSHARSALTLAGLVRRILAETGVERIRLSSIEPQHVDDDLLETWIAGAPRTLPHVHLPLQSGDDGVLRRMGRRYDAAAYARVVERVRAAIPGVAVHADAITGFPSEDDAAFDRSIAFIRGLELAGLHVFRYSARPGTPATRMAGQVGEAEKKRRAAQLLALAADARARFAASTVGRVADVLVETQLEDGRWLGHAEDYVPVVVRPRIGDPPGLEHAILRVRRVAVDRELGDRVVGEIESLDLPSSRPRPTLPVLDPRRDGPAGRRARHRASTPTPAQAPAAGGFDVR
jgi:threonylcarbamoyladenosine tRNA methylthiotransferase MtaB